MKILIRVLGLGIIAYIVTICSIYLINTNIISNELNDASALAMVQTQDVMKEIMISRLDREEKDLFYKSSYKEYYINCFKELVLDENKYNITIDADKSTGVIYAQIETPQYKLIPTKRLLNIINVEGEHLEDIESHYYEEKITEELNKISKTKWNGIKARTLETWTFDESVKILGGEVEVYGIESRSMNPNTIIGPKIELKCIDENDKTTIMGQDEGGFHTNSYINFDECYECKIVELIMTEDLNPDQYGLKTDSVVAKKNSGIYLEKIEMVEKEDYKLSDEVEIYSRYIDDISKLNEKSIWLQDERYKEVLKEYLNKLK